jgi:outer membrane biosynthesis protein TonB
MRLSDEPVGVRQREVSPASKEGMSRAVAWSVALHLALGGLVVFGLPDLFHSAPSPDQPVAVDLVTIDRETRATRPNPYVPRPHAKPDIPPADAAAPKPRPKPQPPLPAPPPSSGGAPPQPQPTKIEKAEWEPPPPPKPPLAKPPLPQPQATPRPAAAVAVPRPREKPRPPVAVAKQETRPRRERKTYDPGAFEALLKNLAPEHNAPSPDLPPRTQRLASAEASSQPRAPLGAALTASEIDLIRQQIERCWNIPEGARDDKDLVVEIRVFVDPDGNVRQAVILDQARLVNDPVFRAAADSARRALFNPQCRPLRLPPDKYEYWKEFVMDFSPKDLL